MHEFLFLRATQSQAEPCSAKHLACMSCTSQSQAEPSRAKLLERMIFTSQKSSESSVLWRAPVALEHMGMGVPDAGQVFVWTP